jgi:non-specific serine/threonine protein kinase
MSLDADFLVVGAQIFRKEYQRFREHFRYLPFSLIVDEASQLISSIDSQIHERVFEFQIGHPVMLLTGTPAMNPMHAYALLKFVAPLRYRNLKNFESIHVAEYDFFGKPCRFKNLDVLAESLDINSSRLQFEDMFEATDPPMVIPLAYELDPQHYKLYTRLAEEELLRVEDEGKVDATTAARLFHMLGQIVVNWGHFAGDPSLVSNAIEIVREKVEELGNEKMVVFCHYRMTAALLHKEFEAVSAGVINGDATSSQREKAKAKFISDPTARLLIVQARSGGFGMDGLQHVCNTALFIEPVSDPGTYHQAVARLHRTGQRRRVRVYYAVAEGTLQPRAFKMLLKRGEVAAKVMRSVQDLRSAIFSREDVAEAAAVA